jgi:hypothetical protein
MIISVNGRLDWLYFVHAKLFEYVTSILRLANEGTLFGLLDLKSKKECKNLHHGHLKYIRYYLVNSSQTDLFVKPNIISSA